MGGKSSERPQFSLGTHQRWFSPVFQVADRQFHASRMVTRNRRQLTLDLAEHGTFKVAVFF